MCDCIKTVNAKLAERNTRLVIPWVLRANTPETVMIETEQIEKGRGKPKAVGMFPSHCPFCGVAYKPEEPLTANK